MFVNRDWLNLRLVNKQFNKLILEYLPLNRVLYQPIRKGKTLPELLLQNGLISDGI